VAQIGQQARLQVIPAAPRPADPATQVLQSALRQFLPTQGSTAATAAGAQSALASPQAQSLPAGARQALESMLQALPARAEVTSAAGLRRAVADSGLFLEAGLGAAASAGARPAMNDLLSTLLRVLQQLRAPQGSAARPGTAPQGSTAGAAPEGARPSAQPPPSTQAAPAAQARQGGAEARVQQALPTDPQALAGQLRQLTEGAVARVRLHQVATAEANAGGEPRAWVVELPIRQDPGFDTLQLRIREREARSGGAEATVRYWEAEFGIDLPGLGPLWARVRTTGEEVSTQLWLADPRSAETARVELPALRQRLEAKGLEVGALSTAQGAPQDEGPPRGPLLRARA
jgi:hypothetical protein